MGIGKNVRSYSPRKSKYQFRQQLTSPYRYKSEGLRQAVCAAGVELSDAQPRNFFKPRTDIRNLTGEASDNKVLGWDAKSARAPSSIEYLFV
jgi:hypothetical protein